MPLHAALPVVYAAGIDTALRANRIAGAALLAARVLSSCGSRSTGTGGSNPIAKRMRSSLAEGQLRPRRSRRLLAELQADVPDRRTHHRRTDERRRSLSAVRRRRARTAVRADDRTGAAGPGRRVRHNRPLAQRLHGRIREIGEEAVHAEVAELPEFGAEVAVVRRREKHRLGPQCPDVDDQTGCMRPRHEVGGRLQRTIRGRRNDEPRYSGRCRRRTS